MKKYFLIIFVTYIGLNTVYNSYIYFSCDKVEAKVIGFDRYVSKYKSRKSGKSTEISDSPLVVFAYKDYDYEVSRNEWGHINLLDIGDKVTVLIDEKTDEVRLHTFFQFWFTLYDIFIAFSLCFVGTIILESLFPTREKAPKVWK